MTGERSGTDSRTSARATRGWRRLKRRLALSTRRLSRILALAVSNFVAHDYWLWASVLTYTVALSIVPLLVLVFAALKGLGEEARVEPLILNYLSLDSPVIRAHLRDFIANSRAGALGSLGAGSLVVCDIMTLRTIEIAFNRIWQVKEGRPFIRTISDYLSVTFTVPILLAAALTLASTYGDELGRIPFAARVTPFFMIWAGYAFLFMFFPYTTVRYGAALAGSFVTSILWIIAYWAYVHFQYQASYQPVYGALAAIPALLVWIYLSWSIVLFGAEIAAAAQYGASQKRSGGEKGRDFTRRAGLLLTIRIAQRMLSHRGPVTARDVARELGANETDLDPVLQRLKHAGLLVEGKADASTNHGDYELLLCRAPSAIPVEAILDAVEEPRAGRTYDWRIKRLLARLENNERNLLKGETLHDLVVSEARPTQARL